MDLSKDPLAAMYQPLAMTRKLFFILIIVAFESSKQFAFMVLFIFQVSYLCQAIYVPKFDKWPLVYIHLINETFLLAYFFIFSFNNEFKDWQSGISDKL